MYSGPEQGCNCSVALALYSALSKYGTPPDYLSSTLCYFMNDFTARGMYKLKRNLNKHRERVFDH